MSSLGETLQRARVEQGLGLDEIARRLKISPKYLTAIEANDRASLPSAFFYRSFVQQYAAALSFNARQIGAQLDQVLSNEEPPPLPGQDGNPIRKREPEVQVRSGRRGLYVSLASAATLLAASGAFYLWWTKTGQKDSVSTAIQKMSVIAPKKLTETLPPSRPQTPATQIIPAAMAAETVRPAPEPVKIDHVVLNLVAKEQTWLSVYSDGKHVYAGVLHANESKAIEGKQFARMTIGNAGGLEVQFNGKTIGALGARGQVRTVLFTRDNFEIVQSAKDGV
jgi:cytoskeletal protein RodZ